MTAQNRDAGIECFLGVSRIVTDFTANLLANEIVMLSAGSYKKHERNSGDSSRYRLINSVIKVDGGRRDDLLLTCTVDVFLTAPRTTRIVVFSSISSSRRSASYYAHP